MMARLKLTAENYYSQEANWQYMSASQFKSFRRCEAAAMAELRGEWVRKDSTALLVGSYVDAHFSGEMEQFRAEHPQIFKKDGTLKAEFIHAQAICDRLEADELSRLLLSGKHQTIKTGKIAGVWYKTKSDSLLSARQAEAISRKFPAVKKLLPFGGPMIVDLKCMADFDLIWDEEMQQRVNFMEYWGYDFQGAIYQKIDNRFAAFVIVAATKEAEPDIGAFHIPDGDLAVKLAEVEELSPRYDAIKRGEIRAVGCGRCAYCRSKKKLTEIMNYNMIGG